jgi:glutathione S-transferase
MILPGDSIYSHCTCSGFFLAGWPYVLRIVVFIARCNFYHWQTTFSSVMVNILLVTARKYLMIYLHSLEYSRALRIAWLLEALALEYELVPYQRDPQTYGAPDTLKQIHPLGKSPVIVDGDLTIAESGAIIEYLIDVYDQEGCFKPSSGQALLDYRYWLHFAEGSMMMWLVMRLVLMKAKEKIPFLLRPVIGTFINRMDQYVIQPRVSDQFKFVEAFLSEHKWFAGEQLSGADFQMMLALTLAEQRADLSSYPNIQRYLERVKQLESYQKAWNQTMK